MQNHVIETLLREWGVSKAVQIILLAAAAASITIVIGANTISNHNKKENYNENEISE